MFSKMKRKFIWILLQSVIALQVSASTTKQAPEAIVAVSGISPPLIDTAISLFSEHGSSPPFRPLANLFMDPSKILDRPNRPNSNNKPTLLQSNQVKPPFSSSQNSKPSVVPTPNLSAVAAPLTPSTSTPDPIPASASKPKPVPAVTTATSATAPHQAAVTSNNTDSVSGGSSWAQQSGQVQPGSHGHMGSQQLSMNLMSNLSELPASHSNMNMQMANTGSPLLQTLLADKNKPKPKDEVQHVNLANHHSSSSQLKNSQPPIAQTTN